MLHKVKLLTPLLILLAACSPSAEEEIVEDTSAEEIQTPVVEEEEVLQEWQVASSEDFWNGSLITIDEETIVLEKALPESQVQVKATYSFEEETDYLSTSEIVKYEVLVPHDEDGELITDEVYPFQNEDFESEEVDEGTLFTSEKTDRFEEYNYLAPAGLHIYEHEEEEMLEVVVLDDQAPIIFIGVPADETLEDTSNISELYQTLNESLRELSSAGTDHAQAQLDEILSITPNSPIAENYRGLIEQAKNYLAAVWNTDGESMQTQIDAMNETNYSNLYGVYDAYASYHENLSPHMDQIASVDTQLADVTNLINSEQYDSAQAELDQISGLYDILNAYYPNKAQEYTTLQAQLEEIRSQNQVNVSDFYGYWANVSEPYGEIGPGSEVLYISDTHFSSLVMHSDNIASGRVEAAWMEGNQLFIQVFFEGTELDGMPDRTSTIDFFLTREADTDRIIADPAGYNIEFLPINGQSVTDIIGRDLAEELREMYP